jgi:dynein heavy chain
MKTRSDEAKKWLTVCIRNL